MTAYRDQYASAFNDGNNVHLIAISDDTPEVQASWAKDADHQFLHASDAGSATFIAYGGDPRPGGQVGARSVVVIGPDGRIAELIPAFNQNDPMAYEHLAEVIDRVTPEQTGK